VDAEDIFAECQRLNEEIGECQRTIISDSRKRGELVMELNQRHGFGMREIGRRLGVSGPRVTQIIAAAREATVSLPEHGDNEAGDADQHHHNRDDLPDVKPSLSPGAAGTGF
jgi:hypothetical protein